MNIVQNNQAKKIIRNSEVVSALAFAEKINQKSITPLLGDNWWNNPLMLHTEGLILAVDADINQNKDSLISESFSLELQGAGTRAELHLWNAHGVITPRPIELNMTMHLNDFVADLFKSAPCGSHVGCWLLVVRNNIVISLKYFSLDDAISSWILNTGKSMLEATTLALKSDNKISHIQHILKGK